MAIVPNLFSISYFFNASDFTQVLYIIATAITASLCHLVVNNKNEREKKHYCVCVVL